MTFSRFHLFGEVPEWRGRTFRHINEVWCQLVSHVTVGKLSVEGSVYLNLNVKPQKVINSNLNHKRFKRSFESSR